MLTRPDLSAAYADPTVKRPARDAAPFRPDQRSERLLSLPEPARERLLAADPRLRISLGLYVQQRTAHEEMIDANR